MGAASRGCPHLDDPYLTSPAVVGPEIYACGMTTEIKDALSQAAAYLREHRSEAKYTDSAATAVLGDGLRVTVSGPGGASLTTDMPKSIGGRSGFGSGFQSRALQRLEPFRQRQALPRGARLEETLEIRTIDQELVSALVRPQAARPYPAAHRLRRPTSDRCSCEYVKLVHDLLRHERHCTTTCRVSVVGVVRTRLEAREPMIEREIDGATWRRYIIREKWFRTK